jgi:hypothetical protein
MADAHTTYHLISVGAVISIDWRGDVYTQPLSDRPVRGTFPAIERWAEQQAATMDCFGLTFDSARCGHCPHCQFVCWVPHHPLWRCDIGGEMNAWTQETITCPDPIEVEEN